MGKTSVLCSRKSWGVQWILADYRSRSCIVCCRLQGLLSSIFKAPSTLKRTGKPDKTCQLLSIYSLRSDGDLGVGQKRAPKKPIGKRKHRPKPLVPRVYFLTQSQLLIFAKVHHLLLHQEERRFARSNGPFGRRNSTARGTGEPAGNFWCVVTAKRYRV